MAKKKNKYFWLPVLGLVLAILGVLDSIDLTIAHYTTPAVLACPENAFINCAKVTSSSYSEIFGIPAPILGLVFFLVMLVLQLPKFWKSNNWVVRNSRLIWSVIGLGSIFWFIYVEFHILNAICLYCTGVHILTFLLFILTVIGTAITADDPKPNREEE